MPSFKKKSIDSGVGESALMNQANERMDEILAEKPEPLTEPEPVAKTTVVQTTVVQQSGVTMGVNVHLPEDYHLRLTMYNKRNHLGGIKNIATKVVMEWIDQNCPK